MQTRLPATTIDMAKPLAKPTKTVSFGHQPSVNFGARKSAPIKFGASDPRGNVIVRFYNWVKNALGLSMDNLEKSTPNVAINAAENRVVAALQQEIKLLSKVIGKPGALAETIKEELKPLHKKEQNEFLAAKKVYQKAAADSKTKKSTLEAFETRLLKEHKEAEEALGLLTQKEAELKIAEQDAKQAEQTIKARKHEAEQAIEKLKKGKADAARNASLEEQLATKRILDEATGRTIGTTNSVGTLLKELNEEKHALRAQLNEGRSNDDIIANMEVEEAIQAEERKSRLADILNSNN